MNMGFEKWAILAETQIMLKMTSKNTAWPAHYKDEIFFIYVYKMEL